MIEDRRKIVVRAKLGLATLGVVGIVPFQPRFRSWNLLRAINRLNLGSSVK